MMTKKVAPFVKGRLTNSLTQIDYWEVCCMTHFPFFFSDRTIPFVMHAVRKVLR